MRTTHLNVTKKDRSVKCGDLPCLVEHKDGSILLAFRVMKYNDHFCCAMQVSLGEDHGHVFDVKFADLTRWDGEVTLTNG